MLFGILKVRVKTARGKWITAEAFLDSGSDRSLVSEAFARKAGWKSHNKCDVLVTGAGNKTHEERSGRVYIVLDTDEGDAEMDVWTLSEVTAPLEKADWPSIKKSFPHLSDLPLTANSGKPDLLIGLDHAWLQQGREYRGAPRMSRLLTRPLLVGSPGALFLDSVATHLGLTPSRSK